MKNFIGRQNEIEAILRHTNKKSASFIVLKGRRRVGKSRLIEEISKHFKYYYKFEGLAPESGITDQHQKDAVMQKFSAYFNSPINTQSDWSNIFWSIGEKIKTGKTLLFFDELSWMGMNDETFLPKLKLAWDEYFKKNDQLIFIVCASASSWIQKNLMNGSGFVGRISYSLTLESLPLNECRLFWPKNISNYEILKVLSVTGGIPKYLEEIHPKEPAEENIKRLCFSPGGMLVNEFNQIFSDVFLRESHYYQAVVRVLASGQKDLSEIQAALNLETPGRLSEYLDELKLAGFIKRDYTWSIKSTLDSKLSKYRLSDNYLRFYVKYIEKNIDKIDRNTFSFKSLASLSSWKSIMALQFENLVLANRSFIHQKLGLAPDDIVSENPYFQRKTSRSKGCQIDYLIQTRFNTLYVCEIKFYQGSINNEIINEVQAKIDSIAKPKTFSCRPVLIYIGDISDHLKELNYFNTIINFEEIFNQ